MRIGIGYDLHRMRDGIPLRIGAVAIPFPRGPEGHSDGDVLLHALADALLGAAGLGDIGDAFPDTDPATEGMDSRRIVEDTLRQVAERGFEVENVDAIVHAEAPRIKPYREAIRSSIAGMLGLDVERVGLKAKTGEGIGEVGRGEAIAAEVAVLLRETLRGDAS
ncbi:MAG: 2-C-methyl-D-erythritol 2,4-cyclodiphosphate synthase [Planctomycetota bacterium]|nr:2-C-methyl-D-erythritol 2,4-cyclodiphosphate synthase [Planctomycetota bacterium]